MFRPAIRASSQRICSPLSPQSTYTKRFLGTATGAKKAWKWKSTVFRWGLALGAVYYYNTSDWFTKELKALGPYNDNSTSELDAPSHPTIDAIIEERRKKKSQSLPDSQATKTAPDPSQEIPDQSDEVKEDGDDDRAAAFNPETGEINWDCPCLGGMAHGPCGEEFKEAFSCFVHSKEEPKGVECIDRFSVMQNCFRKHPDIYGAELEGDEDATEAMENVEPITSKKEVDKVIENPGLMAQPLDKTDRLNQTNLPVNQEAQDDTFSSKT